MNLVLLEPEETVSPDVRLTGRRARHLRHVLRATSGQQVRVGILDGPCGRAVVTGVDEDAVTLRCAFDDGVASRPAVDLLLALPRPKVMQRLWAQLAALGVDRILVTNAERVEPDYWSTHVLDESTYRPLLVEGLAQARDTRLPRVTLHRRFRVLVEDELDALVPGTTRIAAHPDASADIGHVVAAAPGERVLLAVGPEGGWNTFERGLLETHGFRLAGIGSRPLRSDTACVALLAITHAAMRGTWSVSCTKSTDATTAHS